MKVSPKLCLALVAGASSLLAGAAEYKPLEDAKRPIATTQALTPAEAIKKMALPPGFSVQIVAGEPDIVQPVAYTIDDRGRLWVIQNTNYPNCPGEPKDHILIFEDEGTTNARSFTTSSRSPPGSRSASAECGSARRRTCSFFRTRMATTCPTASR